MARRGVIPVVLQIPVYRSARERLCTPAACDQAIIRRLRFFVKNFLRTLVFCFLQNFLLDILPEQAYLVSETE